MTMGHRRVVAAVLFQVQILEWGGLLKKTSPGSFLLDISTLLKRKIETDMTLFTQ